MENISKNIINISTFTPNRIGEYGGRVFCLEKGDRVKGVLITIIGSIAQFLTKNNQLTLKNHRLKNLKKVKILKIM